MSKGELVRFTSLPMYPFVCRYVSPMHTMAVENTNDHIYLWESEVAPETELLILWFVYSGDHKIVQLSLEYLNIVCV